MATVNAMFQALFQIGQVAWPWPVCCWPGRASASSTDGRGHHRGGDLGDL
jgi:hypothetical protein